MFRNLVTGVVLTAIFSLALGNTDAEARHCRRQRQCCGYNQNGYGNGYNSYGNGGYGNRGYGYGNNYGYGGYGNNYGYGHRGYSTVGVGYGHRGYGYGNRNYGGVGFYSGY